VLGGWCSHLNRRGAAGEIWPTGPHRRAQSQFCHASMGHMTGTLTLAATPLGNPADASPRLSAALADAQLVAAEDTRRVRRLAADLQVAITATIVSLFEGNEAARSEALLTELRAGTDVLLLTDAGMPLVSDPGFRLVAACAKEDIPVTVLPGPSAVLAALAVSGLPADRFCFEGFLPRRSGERRRRLQQLADDQRTLVFFESPRRTATTLAELAEIFGADRRAAVCRELTKTHEEVVRGELAELVSWSEQGVRGEITLVIAGAPERTAAGDPESWRAEVTELVAAGRSTRDAVAEVAQRTGAPRKQVYQAVHDS
jgi:16S rRNA (cytidine1402-2'-O)-methyltransferase